MTAILFLHGGGHSNHTRYTQLIERFSTHGIICHAFDHHADSLSGRLDEAESQLSIIKSINSLSDSDIFVWGSSMGGHIACRLTSTHPQLSGVILQSAATYSQAAETIPFGSDFTAELHRDNSWQDSLSFPAINSYPGPVLVMYGENDDVIPTGVKQKYTSRANQNGVVHTLIGAGHSLLRPSTLTEHHAWEEMYNHSLAFIKSL